MGFSISHAAQLHMVAGGNSKKGFYPPSQFHLLLVSFTFRFNGLFYCYLKGLFFLIPFHQLCQKNNILVLSLIIILLAICSVKDMFADEFKIQSVPLLIGIS